MGNCTVFSDFLFTLYSILARFFFIMFVFIDQFFFSGTDVRCTASYAQCERKATRS